MIRLYNLQGFLLAESDSEQVIANIAEPGMFAVDNRRDVAFPITAYVNDVRGTNGVWCRNVGELFSAMRINA